jgi:hypothetical protein
MVLPEAVLFLAAGAVALVRRAPSVAAIAASTGLQILGVYGILLGAIWRPSFPTQFYGVVALNGQATPNSAASSATCTTARRPGWSPWGCRCAPPRRCSPAGRRRHRRRPAAAHPHRRRPARRPAGPGQGPRPARPGPVPVRRAAVRPRAARRPRRRGRLPAQGPGVQRRPVHRRDPHRRGRRHGPGPRGDPQAARPALPHRAADPPDRPGTRGARADGRGPVQRRDRPAPVRHREGGQQARRRDLRQAGPGPLRRRQPPCPGRPGLP